MLCTNDHVLSYFDESLVYGKHIVRELMYDARVDRWAQQFFSNVFAIKIIIFVTELGLGE